MVFDFKMIRNFYSELKYKIDKIRSIINRPMTFSEKILYTHLTKQKEKSNISFSFNKNSYINFYPDRVAMQDATAQMTLLQFMQTNKVKTEIPTTIHCDHLIYANEGASIDLKNSLKINKEIYDFLKIASYKYGIDFWEPGSGIIHQIVLENYAFPGGMMIGTDSHTPNAGGLGMLAIGVGGSDAAEVMSGYSFELKFPKLIGVLLEGKISGWVSPKDIILKLSGMIGVMGASNSIIEYFGDGTKNIPCTGKATICNMGAELGASSSLFPYDYCMKEYLLFNNRKEIVSIIDGIKDCFQSDIEVYNNPYHYYDKVIKIDLSTLEPHINGPFTPDKSTSISNMKKEAKINNWPTNLEVGLIGSCTNSSCEDLLKSVNIIKQAINKKLKIKSEYLITPGSNKVYYFLKKNGYLDLFKKIGAKVFANACGPCIGQWKRTNKNNNNKKNTIIHSFNRNFSSRNDGNPNTHAFIASPEIVTAMVFSGNIDFNPITDNIKNELGEYVKFEEPKKNKDIFNEKEISNDVKKSFYKHTSKNSKPYNISIIIKNNSDRLQFLSPFSSWNGKNLLNIRLLIKVKGKCTTDHISMAGPWLKYRGHLENISENLLIKAINYFNNKENKIKNVFTDKYGTVPNIAKFYKSKNIFTLIVGEDNYGEGSSREHAAMEPRFLGVRVVLVKSFSRIHETNLKKQGILALTFSNPHDYYKIDENDIFNFYIKDNFFPGKNIKIDIIHSDKKIDKILAKHSYNKKQIQWFKYGSSLNFIRNCI
ncbi:aconitate hydratase [Blattabacterium cuenoti]|uniref:aconitate hydratase n=1 Tax=Blattabacterium cuenoti TaxID=1653831 RepID=UPI00163B7AD6|nr:aconitate hydratase [Blattabacterium cuenoti]